MAIAISLLVSPLRSTGTDNPLYDSTMFKNEDDPFTDIKPETTSICQKASGL